MKFFFFIENTSTQFGILLSANYRVQSSDTGCARKTGEPN